ncbi:hypothetical protein BKA56DRAFT_621707 [Ilyonectria sp. MPI-CAGE-AT-0026]|nr:hypothetical protein BKA56DRAFT_621707 [Ilyonectria sp. MPI-CAGE-AT-0026]
MAGLMVRREDRQMRFVEGVRESTTVGGVGWQTPCVNRAHSTKQPSRRGTTAAQASTQAPPRLWLCIYEYVPVCSVSPGTTRLPRARGNRDNSEVFLASFRGTNGKNKASDFLFPSRGQTQRGGGGSLQGKAAAETRSKDYIHRDNALAQRQPAEPSWHHRHAPASELSIVDADADAHERREKGKNTAAAGWVDRLRADFLPGEFRPVASPGVVHRSPAQRQSGRRRVTEKHDGSILRNSQPPLRKASVGCEHARNHPATPSVSHVECPTPVTI